MLLATFSLNVKNALSVGKVKMHMYELYEFDDDKGNMNVSIEFLTPFIKNVCVKAPFYIVLIVFNRRKPFIFQLNVLIERVTGLFCGNCTACLKNRYPS